MEVLKTRGGSPSLLGRTIGGKIDFFGDTVFKGGSSSLIAARSLLADYGAVAKGSL